MQRRVAVLCGDDHHQKYMVNLLSNIFNVELVVVQPQVFQSLMVLRQGKLIDFLYIVYHKIRRELLGLNKYRKLFFKFDKSNCNYTNKLTVADINDKKVLQRLSEVQAEFIIVICTSIIKSELLNFIKGKAINIHGGYLPYYRGNHCFFFALFNQDFIKIGSTIHFIDEGIDTGDIIEHCVPVIGKNDSPEVLYCKSEMLAIHRMVELIKIYDSPFQMPRMKQTKKFKLYRNRDRGIIKEILFLWRHRKA